MKRKHNNRTGYANSENEEKVGGLGVAIGMVAVLIVVLLCVLIWQIFHREKPASPVTVQPSQETFNDTLKDTVASESVVKPSASGVREPLEGSNDLGLVFEDITDVVTAKDETNLRSEPSTEKGGETVVVLLKNGETIERIGINQELGWSKLLYEDQIVYASTALLVQVQEDGEEGEAEAGAADEQKILSEIVIISNGKHIAIQPCEDEVAPKVPVNLRTEPSAEQGDASIYCQAEAGEHMKRTGYDENTGWSRVEYEGQVLYVVTKLVKVLEAE